MSIKKSNRYLILTKVNTVHGILKHKQEKQEPTYTAQELTGEEALLFLRKIDIADNHCIYQLGGPQLVLQTTVVCAVAPDTVEIDVSDLVADDKV